MSEEGKGKNVKPCPIYGTSFCPMAWISYGFERIYVVGERYDEVFSKKEQKLIENLIPDDELPGCFKRKDSFGVLAWINTCPHWNYFKLLWGPEIPFNYKECHYYSRYEELGPKKTLEFYMALIGEDIPKKLQGIKGKQETELPLKKKADDNLEIIQSSQMKQELTELQERTLELQRRKDELEETRVKWDILR